MAYPTDVLALIALTWSELGGALLAVTGIAVALASTQLAGRR